LTGLVVASRARLPDNLSCNTIGHPPPFPTVAASIHIRALCRLHSFHRSTSRRRPYLYSMVTAITLCFICLTCFRVHYPLRCWVFCSFGLVPRGGNGVFYGCRGCSTSGTPPARGRGNGYAARKWLRSDERLTKAGAIPSGDPTCKHSGADYRRLAFAFRCAFAQLASFH